MRRSVSVKATNLERVSNGRDYRQQVMTYEGVVRLPWSLAIISMRSSRKIPTQE